MTNYVVIQSEPEYITYKVLKSKIHLSALIDEKKDGTFKYIMPSLSFSHKAIHEELDKDTIFWDVAEYIFTDFKKYLTDILYNRKTQAQLLEFKDVASFLVNKKQVQDILDMIKLAERQNWQVDYDYDNQTEIFHNDKIKQLMSFDQKDFQV